MGKKIRRIEVEGINSEHFPRSAEATTNLFLAHYVRRAYLKSKGADPVILPPPPGAPMPPGAIVLESEADFKDTIRKYKTFAGLLNNRRPTKDEWWKIFLRIMENVARWIADLFRNFLIALLMALLIVLIVLYLIGYPLPTPNITFN